jgi:NADH-quinone oxidoreductase subunit I
METREESILTKDKLLALGDRFESEIAEARNKDAAYR